MSTPVFAEAKDETLVQYAAAGSHEALTLLVERHQNFVYNVALRFALNPVEAQDLAQEALIKVVTRVAQFDGRSAFRTWAYRIVVNTFLDAQRGALEGQITSFAAYGKALDTIPLQALETSSPDAPLLVEEAKLGCMLGMLLCLDREQRLTFIVGDLLGIPSPVASEIFSVPPNTFRKRLQRARADLRNFMDAKCGLVNADNPCRCRLKTTGFVRAGWVDPVMRRFAAPHVRRLRQEAIKAVPRVDDALGTAYRELFQDHPYYDAPDVASRVRHVLADGDLREAFDI